MKNKAIFLDRDGTIIEFPPNEEYVNNKIENLKFIPKTIESIKFLNSIGYKIFVITNQAGVTKGYSTLDELEKFNLLLKTDLSNQNVIIDKIYYCIHPDTENCTCRKPESGMLLQAANEYNINLTKSWMIGDSKCDMQCGFKAGCKTIMVETGHGKQELEKYDNNVQDDEETIPYNYVVKNLYEATKIIFSQHSIDYVKELENNKNNKNKKLVRIPLIYNKDRFRTLIGIQTYNNLKYTKRLIYSLILHQNISTKNIFVIDNSSNDGTLEFLEKSNISFQTLNPRQCSAAGMNIILEHFKNSCKYQYLIMLNNDIVLHPNFIDTIISDFKVEEANKCMLMCGVQSSIDNTENQWDCIINQQKQDINDEVMPGDFSAFILNKNTIDIIGKFDEIFKPRYIEDNDYTHRIYLLGGKVIRNGKCTFHHEGSLTNKMTKEDPLEILRKNSEIYKEKWGEYQKGAERIIKKRGYD